MHHTEAHEDLLALIDSSGKTAEELTTADIFNLSLSFYETPCDDCSRDDEGDALLFQCGIYDFGQGADLEVDIVRQFTVNGLDGEFDHIEQLHATLYYPVELAAGKEIDVSIWSSDCGSMAEFRERVTELPGYKLVQDAKPVQVKIYQERV